MASYYIEIPPGSSGGTVTSVTASAPLSSSGGINPNITITQSSTTTDGYLSSTDFNTFNNKVSDAQIYYHYPVTVGVIENDVVMNVTNAGTGQAPLSFTQATNNDQQYYVQLYGIAKNVSGGFADIYLGMGSVVSGFSFGAFIGIDYYIDPTNPGKLTFTPPVGQLNVIKVGRALSATQLVLNIYSQFVQDKGAIYTSDGSGYDSTLLVGANGNVLVANSAATNGINWAPAVVAAAPFTYTTATRTLTIATATNAVSGILSAADHTTFAAKQSATLTSAHILVGNGSNVATDVAMTGDVAITNAGVTSITAATVTGKLITGFVSGSGVVAATDTILQAINKLNGNSALKAPLASPTFTGDINSSTGNLLISTIGKGLQVKTGANAKIGTATLVGGTITVANTSVTANSKIFFSVSAAGGTQGFLRYTKIAATSFTVTSTTVLDTSTLDWCIVESIP